MDMTNVGVAVLKERLSECLRRVEEVDEVVIAWHRRIVARIVPEPGDGIRVRPPVEPLEHLAAIRGVVPRPGYSAVASLIEDRSGR